MSDAADGTSTRRRMPPRARSNFLTRTATDNAEQLERRHSMFPSPSPQEEAPLPEVSAHSNNPYEPVDNDESQSGQQPQPNLLQRLFFSDKHGASQSHVGRQASSGHRKTTGHSVMAEDSLTAQMHAHGDNKRHSVDVGKPRPGAFPRPVGGTSKLGTFAGVFVPTTLNVLSILMFLRFGFILGQGGVVGMLGMRCSNSLSLTSNC